MDITTTSMPATDMFAATLAAGANIVVSTVPGLGTVTHTLAELNSLNSKVLIVDALALSEIGTGYLDPTAEVVVVDEAHLALPLVREQIAELMLKRTINGEEMTQLKSVVVFFTHRNPETDQYAAQLAALGPALSINLS